MQDILELEELAEKKAAIYARLLMDTALAKKMEELSLRHAERRRGIEALATNEEGKRK